MTRILGIDPGKGTGWCLYDADARRVLECGTFEGHGLSREACDAHDGSDAVVIERLRPHGASYPQVVEAAYTAGRLAEWFSVYGDVVEITRDVVRRILQDSVHGSIKVRDDKTVWAALVALHGENSDRKPRRKAGKIVDPGGSIGLVRGHERAALAVAVAFSLRDAPLSPSGSARCAPRQCPPEPA